MTTSQRIQQWWQQRNPRERAMLVVMLVAVAAFVYWYALVWPLRSVREAARADYSAATTQLRQVQADAARLESLALTVPADPGSLSATLQQAALEAGIALSRQRPDAEGQWVVELDAVDSRPLFEWLELLQTRHGLQPANLAAEREGARLRVKATFSPIQQ